MKKQISFIIMLLASCFVCIVSAMFVQPSAIPLARIVKNTEAYLEKKPDDSKGYYTLGRIYYLGFFNRASFVPGFAAIRDGESPRVSPDWLIGNYEYIAINAEAEKRALIDFGISALSQLPTESRQQYYEKIRNYHQKLRAENWKPVKVSKDIAISYAIESKDNFKKAINMDGNVAIYHLGLASLYQQVLTFLESYELESRDFSHVNKELIVSTYWKAFELSVRDDSKLKNTPISGLRSIVSYEAGNAWLELGGNDERKIESIEFHLSKLKDLRYGGITPLVITTNNVSVPTEFILGHTFVRFDLDGEGHVELWEWTTPSTGFLVWDPTDQRSIKSGVQMFGNYTFQIIWNDGFHALSSLDDNGDQTIDGAELDGLSLWYDGNSNGVSESHEIRSVHNHGIVSLTFDNLEIRDGMKVSNNGVSYNDSRKGHLWDWISNRANKDTQQGDEPIGLPPRGMRARPPEVLKRGSGTQIAEYADKLSN